MAPAACAPREHPRPTQVRAAVLQHHESVEFIRIKTVMRVKRPRDLFLDGGEARRAERIARQHPLDAG